MSVVQMPDAAQPSPAALPVAEGGFVVRKVSNTD